MLSSFLCFSVTGLQSDSKLEEFSHTYEETYYWLPGKKKPNTLQVLPNCITCNVLFSLARNMQQHLIALLNEVQSTKHLAGLSPYASMFHGWYTRRSDIWPFILLSSSYSFHKLVCDLISHRLFFFLPSPHKF